MDSYSTSFIPAHVEVGNSVRNSDVMRDADVWKRDRPRGVARGGEIQGQKHAAHMLQAYGL